MKYRKLGKSGLEVSEVGIGAWQMGGLDFLDGQSHGWHGTSDDESAEIIDKAEKAGINFIDTAPAYGGGHSEEVIGQNLKGGRRQKWLISTKVGWAKGAEGERITAMTPDFIRTSLEASLKRLQTDYVDIFMLHFIPEPPDREAAVETIIALKKEGKARAIGVSSCYSPAVQELQAIQPGWIETVQEGYSLLDRNLEQMLGWCQEQQIGVVARSVLAMGMLSGRYWDNPDQIPAGDIRQQWFVGKEKAGQLKELTFLQANGARTQVQAAARFVLDNPAIASVVLGTKNVAQLAENVAASHVPPLTEAEREQAFKIVT